MVVAQKIKSANLSEKSQNFASAPQKFAERKNKDFFRLAKKINLSELKPIQSFLKRCFDFIVALVGLITILPLLIVIAIAIKLESNGPVFFKQKRVGLYGKEFNIYKFRSMKVNAEADLEKLKKYNETNSAMFKMKNDPRVTQIGKFIRKYSIDELPQLINVLKGEMSLVGFRPPIKRELEAYKDWHYVRFATRPGLTGAWQVSGRSNIKNFDNVITLEFVYINNWSLLFDFKILLKTVPVVLLGKDTA